jgi:hypothetical protein
MNIVEICTIIGTVISLGIILYKIGRLSSKIDSNTHRLDKKDSLLYKNKALRCLTFPKT